VFKSGLQNFKFLSNARGTISNWGLNGAGRKNVRFRRKTGHISETVRDTAKFTINL